MSPRESSNNQDRTVEWLVRGFTSKGRHEDALCTAAMWGYLDLVKELLASSLSADDRTQYLSSALASAASAGQTRVVKHLIKCGADVNAVTGKNGMTPLIACVAALHSKKVYLSICKVLLDSGATESLGVRDVNGSTALDWAKDGRPSEVVTLIEERMRERPDIVEEDSEMTVGNGPSEALHIPELELRHIDGRCVAVYGSHEIPLPSPARLKADAIEVALAFGDGPDDPAVAILEDADLDYEVVQGKDAVEMLIGVIVTVSPENAAVLEEDGNGVLPDVMGALLEACPDLGTERIVARRTS